MKNYVKEFKGYKVPEGAEEFGGKDDYYLEDFFYRDEGSKVFINGQWSKTLSERADLIPLPEAPQEWTPEIGESCLGLIPVNRIKRDFLEVFVLFHFEDAGIYAVRCKQDSTLHYCKVFKPLKTQEEEDREEFINSAREIARTTEEVLMTHDRLFGLLFDNGAVFTTPKGEE